MTKPKAKTIVIISLLVAIAIVLVFLLRGCKATDYSVEKHVERISERVQERYMGGDSEYTSFTVHPLYDADDNFANVCVVDFEPHGFLYVLVRDLKPFLQLFGINGMYSVALSSNKKWFRYRLSEKENISNPSNGRYWTVLRNSYGEEIPEVSVGDNNHCFYEVDENGERVYMKDSHFKGVAEEGERRYLLSIKASCEIPAVKRNGKFFSAISLEEFEYSPELDLRSNPCMSVSVPPYSQYDL